jgi:hypothetical protein
MDTATKVCALITAVVVLEGELVVSFADGSDLALPLIGETVH